MGGTRGLTNLKGASLELGDILALAPALAQELGIGIFSRDE